MRAGPAGGNQGVAGLSFSPGSLNNFLCSSHTGALGEIGLSGRTSREGDILDNRLTKKDNKSIQLREEQGMRKKILWLVVSGLMALSLVMAACGPAVVEENKVEEKQAPVVEEKKPEVAVEKEVVAPAPEVPKYGGTLTAWAEESSKGFGTWEPIIFPNSVN